MDIKRLRDAIQPNPQTYRPCMGRTFFSRIIENLRSYLIIFSYIDAHPLVAGLVNRAEDWLYGRFRLRVIGFENLLSSPDSWDDLP
jgi:hypothetical protein